MFRAAANTFWAVPFTYSNMAKHKLINVSEESLEAYGAVSWQVACEMAQGVRELFGTTYGVGITGIAGPGRATEDKPVGLVYMAVADTDGVKWAKHVLAVHVPIIKCAVH